MESLSRLIFKLIVTKLDDVFSVQLTAGSNCSSGAMAQQLRWSSITSQGQLTPSIHRAVGHACYDGTCATENISLLQTGRVLVSRTKP
jgi:hypothetical protein